MDDHEFPHRLALRRAVEAAGGQRSLARSIGCLQQQVWDWLNTAKTVPVHYALLIEAKTGVPAAELAPGVFEGFNQHGVSVRVERKGVA